MVTLSPSPNHHGPDAVLPPMPLASVLLGTCKEGTGLPPPGSASMSVGHTSGDADWPSTV